MANWPTETPARLPRLLLPQPARPAVGSPSCVPSAPPWLSAAHRPPARPAAASPPARHALRPRSPRPSPAARPGSSRTAPRLAAAASGPRQFMAPRVLRRPARGCGRRARTHRGTAQLCLGQLCLGQIRRRPAPSWRGQPFGGEPVQVPPRAARLRLVLPARLDQAPVGQPDQDRVQRARLQPGLPGQRVAVLPP